MSFLVPICCLSALCLVQPVAAQTGTPFEQAAQKRADKSDMRTGKERLGHKWTDEQRIDNCNVPIDKRGNKPRPVACPKHLTD